MELNSSQSAFPLDEMKMETNVGISLDYYNN